MSTCGQGSQQNAEHRKEFCKQNTMLLGNTYDQNAAWDFSLKEKVTDLEKF
jgi:hypothetical protein